jgi:PEP-CTERM motif
MESDQRFKRLKIVTGSPRQTFILPVRERLPRCFGKAGSKAGLSRPGRQSFVSRMLEELHCPSKFHSAVKCAGWPAKRSLLNVARPSPEPSAWAMMILGLCGLGFVARRRTRNGTALRLG